MPAASLNLKNPSVRRIMAELKEFHRDPPEGLVVRPLEDNLSEVHFTFRGPSESPYENGLYHGRIRLPTEYPFKPPSIYMSTASGRFETDTNICLNVLSHYPENWQPAWGIRTVLLALSGFMVMESPGSIGSIEYTNEERIALAKRSHGYACKLCGMKHSELQLGSNVRKSSELNALEEVFKVMFATQTPKAKADGSNHAKASADVKGSQRENSTGEDMPIVSGSTPSTPSSRGPGATISTTRPSLTSISEPLRESRKSSRRRTRRTRQLEHQVLEARRIKPLDILIATIAALLLAIILRRLI